MIPQSATSIADYKRCPTLYRFRHVLRWRPIVDATVLRWGTNWHKCLEILKMEPGSPCPLAAELTGYVPTEAQHNDLCPYCSGTGVLSDDIREGLINYMNAAYGCRPITVNETDWETERTVLLYSALGWQWYWQDDQLETVACEVSFDRKVTPVYRRRGKIDQILRYQGRLLLGEHKSTGQPIDSGSAYWDVLEMDSQISMYLIEARHAQRAGEFEKYGITADDPLISGMLYDVWHKPTIRAKKLTLAESKKFAESGPTADYYDETFEISGGDTRIVINGTEAEVTPGSKEGTFAIRETPEMFGARLLADIREQPEKYFARREIARTDAELAAADKEFSNLARVAQYVELHDLWYHDERACTDRYRCDYLKVCASHQDVSNGQVPDGFRCLNRS